MNTLRECAEAAVRASGADRWEVTQGSAKELAVTIYFNRDTEVAPARTAMFRWMADIGSDFAEYEGKIYCRPVTILPGHSAVEDIEREAFERGLACGKAVCAETPLIPSQIAIDGVEPVVVDGFTWHPSDDFPWCGELKRIDIYKEINGGNCTPCRIHMYVGIGPDGKRAGGNGGES